MTSPENVGQQFKAFLDAPLGTRGAIRAGDLVGNPKVKFWDVDVAGDTMERKLRDSKTRRLGVSNQNLYDSIRENGVGQPVHIANHENGEAMVLSGHHRLAAAHDINPDMQVPFIKMMPGMVMPGYMGAPGNCHDCGGDGRGWNEQTETIEGKCDTCGGEGWVKE